MTNNDRLLTDKEQARLYDKLLNETKGDYPNEMIVTFIKAQDAKGHKIDIQQEQERVERIFKEIEDRGLFKNPEHILLSDKEWEDLKGREGVK